MNRQDTTKSETETGNRAKRLVIWLLKCFRRC